MAERQNEPRRALVMVPIPDLFPSPWFIPTDGPACGAVLDISPEQTRDGVARRFVCDKPAGHESDPADAQHRQVTDNDEGRTLQWPSTGEVLNRAASRPEHSTGSARDALEAARAAREQE